MRLTEQSGIATATLPMEPFRTHLRLGTGFDSDDLQAPILEASLRAALAAIEAQTGKAILERTFIWQGEAWAAGSEQALPLAPVVSLSWAKLVARDGEETPIDLEFLHLERSSQRSLLRPVSSQLPMIPPYGYAELGFVAGYSPDWGGLPADLAQAVLLLAAHFYETRDGASPLEGALPPLVARLIARYRSLRLLGGTAA